MKFVSFFILTYTHIHKYPSTYLNIFFLFAPSTHKGIEDCITPGNKENDRYFLKSDEFVQLHLRNRLRKDECVCFADVKTE